VNVWFSAIAMLTGATALLLSVWVSSRISRPLAALAEKTAVLDLDRLDVDFDEGTDEVGRLSRLLGDLATRLRASTARVREAERRATIGDLARQINHDIKNGLIPLRNVIRHLAHVGRDDPGALPSVLAERRPTIDSSMAYLETLATNYERLSPAPSRRDCDLNAMISNVVRGAHGPDHVEFRSVMAPNLPRIVGNPVALRRILENLTANAVDSLGPKAGVITLSTELVEGEGEPAIRLTVADTGSGLTPEQAGMIFTDFYTTKPGGTGLGLSIVRRLVTDLHGRIRVESVPGEGTRMIVEIPARRSGGGARNVAGHEGPPYDIEP
jgi:signal transduction histidine kinase